MSKQVNRQVEKWSSRSTGKRAGGQASKWWRRGQAGKWENDQAGLWMSRSTGKWARRQTCKMGKWANEQVGRRASGQMSKWAIFEMVCKPILFKSMELQFENGGIFSQFLSKIFDL